METVGLIGIGLVGAAIAERLLHAGYGVYGFDLDATRKSTLEALGGTWGESAAAVAGNVQHLILSLPDSTIVSQVIRDVQGVLPTDGMVIDTTTGDPTETALLGEELAGHGLRYLDAAIVGSSEQVRRREALVLVGGDEAQLEGIREIVGSFAQSILPIGPCGSGQRMKLVVNLVLGLNRAVLAEGLAFAEMLQISPSTALQILRQSAAYSRVMDTKGEKMVLGDFTPQARLKQHLKDVQLILSQARLRNRTLPLSELHAALLERLVKRDLGELDNSAVIQAFRPAD